VAPAAADSTVLFSSSAGCYELHRYPARKNEVLRAWNSADTLLIEQVLHECTEPSDILVVNDDYGALTTALKPVSLWSDSAMANTAIAENCARNQLQPPPICSAVDLPKPHFNIVAMKIPKQFAYFEYQLHTLAGKLPEGAILVASGMDKHLSPKVANLLERHIGPTTRHRGKSKARCFTARYDGRTPDAEFSASKSYFNEFLGVDMLSLANVFSGDKLDSGSRVLIDALRELKPATHCIDLACGNGVLGLSAHRLGLCKTLALCDESAMAIASAKKNAASINPSDLSAISYHHGDGLLDYPGPRAELILSNPPFHSNHTVQEYVGERLLTQSAAHLASSGRLCLVANRHLKYLPVLKRGFSRVEKLSENSKFIVWLAAK